MIKQEKAIIQDAHDFFAWANETQSSSLITYIFVSADECQESQRELSDKTKDLVRVQGTMKLHVVCASGKASVRVRNTSCYCLNCFKDGNFSCGCRGWTLSFLEKQKKTKKLPVHLEPPPVVEDIIQDGTTPTNAEPADEIVTEEGDYVAAVYIHNGKSYIAKVEEVDEDDGEVFLSCMHPAVTDKGTTLYLRPQPPDLLWVRKQCILCIVPEPVEFNRDFKVLPESIGTIDRLFRKWNK